MSQTPLPVQPIDYSIGEDSVIRSLRRFLGLMSVIYGAVEAAMVLLVILTVIASQNGMRGYSGVWRAHFFFSWSFTPLHAVLLTIGGIQCSRGWEGRNLLLVAAWSGLAVAVYSAVVNPLFAIHLGGSYYRSNQMQTVLLFTYYALHAVPEVMFAFFTIILLCQSSIRRHFATAN